MSPRPNQRLQRTCSAPLRSPLSRKPFGEPVGWPPAQSMSFCRYCLSLALVLHAVACATTAGKAQPVPVEIWRGGDDGLTMRLTDSVEEAFKTSGDFVLSRGKKPGSLIVNILNHVRWERVGERERVHYSIGFDNTDGRRLGMSEGSCWSNALSECSSEVLRAARSVGAKILRTGEANHKS